MNIVVITQRTSEGEIEHLHYVMLPKSYGKNFYKEVRAFNSFFYNRKAHGNHSFSAYVGDAEIRLMLLNVILLSRDIPKHRHVNIFDFFIAINYNYKKRKWAGT